MEDPLSILREDVFTNEEVNEMTGKMVREQYLEDQKVEPIEEPEE
jgi:hypothetical protein